MLTGATGIITAVKARGKAGEADARAAEAAATTQEHREQLEAWRGIAAALTNQLVEERAAHRECEERVERLSDDVSSLRTELIAVSRGWDEKFHEHKK